MEDFASRDDFEPAALRARVDAWVKDTGQTELGQVIKTAGEVRDSIRAVLRVDQKTLNKPVTF